MMKNLLKDYRLIIGLILAHLLYYFSFQEPGIFWYIFTGSILALIIYSMLQRKVDDELPFIQYFLLGAISGLLLFFVFWLGLKIMEITHLPLISSIHQLYYYYAPEQFWEYMALILVAAPGEELFWRGYVQKKLLNYFGPVISIAAGAILYTSVQIYSGSFILLLATFISGCVWGAIYFWKKSMPLVIISHIIFDIMIFIILPFK